MWQFIAGITCGCVAGGLLSYLVLLRHSRKRIDTDNASELVELSKLTGELAHEINNPLSTIKVNLKLAHEQLGEIHSDDPRFGRALRKIAIVQAEADRLAEILEDFLRYIGKPELQLELTDLNELVGDVVDFYSPQAYNAAITIRKGFSERVLRCKVDTGMLKQVILNMMINAQQAMPQGGDLMVRTEQQEEWAVIQINDTGCGISAEALPRIFDPYYSRRARGTGLGLATAKKIVAAHRGWIDVASEPDKGSSFSIRLPLSTLSTTA